MQKQNLNRYIKGNILRNVPTTLHKKTSLPEWLELLHDQLANNTEVNSFTFLNKAQDVKCYKALQSAFYVHLMKENKGVVQGLYGKYDDAINRKVEDVLDLAIFVHSKESTKEEMEALRKVAISAYNATNSAASSAASSATNSAYNATISAAYSAAYRAHSAVYSAYNVTISAASSAASSATNSAYNAAYSAAYKKHAEKLMELLEVC